MEPHASWERLDFVAPLGEVATFYVPADKMNDPRYGREGQTPTALFDEYFLEKFGGLTHELSQIQGQWTSSDGQKVFTDQHERYEVSFSGAEKEIEFLNFLADMCGLLEETSIYLTFANRAWLVMPRKPQ